MSVIVRETAPEGRFVSEGRNTGGGNGKVRIFIKGSDETVVPRLWPGQDVAPTKKHIDLLADLGLRTLVLGVRDIDEEAYAGWSYRVEMAKAARAEREMRLTELYDEIERDFKLLGVTAIEDALQAGPPLSCVCTCGFIDAPPRGIKVWMLTGDKHATAVQVALACRLVSPPSERAFMLDVIGNNDDEESPLSPFHRTSQKPIARAGGLGGRGGLLREEDGEGAYTSPPPNPNGRLSQPRVVGDSVNEHLQSLKEGKYQASGITEANTVICCRASPAQKSALVRMIKGAGRTVLAIGDGGNDVPMIQEANIGVGVTGKEGLQIKREEHTRLQLWLSVAPHCAQSSRCDQQCPTPREGPLRGSSTPLKYIRTLQASRASDFSTARFRFLKRLLLVHGRYAYKRSSAITLYSFYRSFFICTIQAPR
ncbi:MAG: hypothetical protein SGPRY_008880 [Prymnesium sp.]